MQQQHVVPIGGGDVGKFVDSYWCHLIYFYQHIFKVTNNHAITVKLMHINSLINLEIYNIHFKRCV